MLVLVAAYSYRVHTTSFKFCMTDILAT